ncbi:MAG: MarR family transcriptional regulator [Verrucomicrobiales bacterium]|jgi:DNA-binding MarR family transcriptional regulator|nr:MarR family transcriptional regulator [Verrucomicrobiales bacterium]
MKTTRSVNSPQIQRLAEVALYLQRNFLALVAETVQKNDMSVPQFNLLGFLAGDEALNMNKLASLMKHTTPATTGLVDRLVRSDLVERLSSPTDRRQVLVKITAKGQAMFKELKMEIAKTLNDIAQKLPDEDLAAWFRIYEANYEYFTSNNYLGT